MPDVKHPNINVRIYNTTLSYGMGIRYPSHLLVILAYILSNTNLEFFPLLRCGEKHSRLHKVDFKVCTHICTCKFYLESTYQRFRFVLISLWAVSTENRIKLFKKTNTR
jgi:hypothetical protein